MIGTNSRLSARSAARNANMETSQFATILPDYTAFKHFELKYEAHLYFLRVTTQLSGI